MTDAFGLPVSSFGTARQSLSRYTKFLSIAYLSRLQLPTLDGLFVMRWSPAAADELHAFIEGHRFDSALIRTDRERETGQYPMGGYLIPKNTLDCEVAHYIQQDRVVLILEPASPFDDYYSLNIAALEGAPEVLVEVTGPGFDASDVKRGQFNPHESISFPRTVFSEGVKITSSHLTRKSVAPAEYRESVRRRLAKIGLMTREKPICRPANFDLKIEIRVDATEDELARAGEQALVKTRNNLLLDHSERYEPIPENLLFGALESTQPLAARLRGLGLPNQSFVVSMSYVSTALRPVFWDIVWPSLKYDIR